MSGGTLFRLSAFTTDPEGGNPAGVWIGDELPPPAEMLRIAREVGYSETAFIAPRNGPRRRVRYFSPEAEVAFCGHATVAAGVQLGESDGEGEYVFETLPGEVPVAVWREDGLMQAELTSVPPRHLPAPASLLRRVLTTLGWVEQELDAAIPPALAYAGSWHLVIAARTAERLAHLDYQFDALRELMLEAGLTTLQLIWREAPTLFHARNPFPVGGIVEDPATGAAAAALGGYLRDAGLVMAPAGILVLQGEAMGRSSRLHVRLPASGGIMVSGHAVPLPAGLAGDRAVCIEVRQDDLQSAGVQALIAEHLSGMHSNSPPGHVHALAIEGLRAPDVTFWTAWLDGTLCGCGALKELDPRTGEIKSMRTLSAFLRRGVGQAVLDEIIRTARRRGYSRLYLETGTGEAFAAAHALYSRNGFEWSGPFGEYTATDFNVFMSRKLD